MSFEYDASSVGLFHMMDEDFGESESDFASFFGWYVDFGELFERVDGFRPAGLVGEEVGLQE